jgi:hypothetical protein
MIINQFSPTGEINKTLSFQLARENNTVQGVSSYWYNMSAADREVYSNFTLETYNFNTD